MVGASSPDRWRCGETLPTTVWRQPFNQRGCTHWRSADVRPHCTSLRVDRTGFASAGRASERSVGSRCHAPTRPARRRPLQVGCALESPAGWFPSHPVRIGRRSEWRALSKGSASSSRCHDSSVGSLGRRSSRRRVVESQLPRSEETRRLLRYGHSSRRRVP